MTDIVRGNRVRTYSTGSGPSSRRPCRPTASLLGGHTMLAAFVVLAAVLLPASTAMAHKVNLFAEVVDGRIVGQVYFAGGGKAQGQTVEVHAADGALCGRATTDEGGEFEYATAAPGEYRLVVDTGDGHRAETVVTVGDAATTAPASDSGLAAQIASLSRRIDHYEQRVRFHDVVGGIGYIVGVFGVVCYLKSRRRSAGGTG